MSLTDEQLSQIRTRHERSRHDGQWRSCEESDTVADRGLLLAEVDRLREALAAVEGLAAGYGARIVAASMAAAPLPNPAEGVAR